jgi:hypothetical protein
LFVLKLSIAIQKFWTRIRGNFLGLEGLRHPLPPKVFLSTPSPSTPVFIFKFWKILKLSASAPFLFFWQVLKTWDDHVDDLVDGYVDVYVCTQNRLNPVYLDRVCSLLSFDIQVASFGHPLVTFPLHLKPCYFVVFDSGSSIAFVWYAIRVHFWENSK